MISDPRFVLRFTLEELRQLRRLVHGAADPLGSEIAAIDFTIVSAEADYEHLNWSVPKLHAVEATP